MAELDYAFLAEFAKVEHGLLNCFGASYTHVYIPKMPATHILHVAGRISADVEVYPKVTLKGFLRISQVRGPVDKARVECVQVHR